MHVLAYLLGLLFYPLVGLTLAIASARPEENRHPLRGWLAVGVFIVASAIQNRAHAELFSLKKRFSASDSQTQSIVYGIPTSFPFRYCLCPHYAAEIYIYLAFAILLPDMTIVLCFVSISLAVNAANQRNWYGTEKVSRWNLFPGVW